MTKRPAFEAMKEHYRVLAEKKGRVLSNEEREALKGALGNESPSGLENLEEELMISLRGIKHAYVTSTEGEMGPDEFSRRVHNLFADYINAVNEEREEYRVIVNED